MTKFRRIDQDAKMEVSQEGKKKIQHHYGSSRISRAVHTVSVPFNYESMMMHGGSATDKNGRQQWNYKRSQCFYGSILHLILW